MHTTEVTPSNAKVYALHYLSHTSNGYDGYSLDDVADTATDLMVDFLQGGMTYEADISPYCDDYCL